MTSTISNLSILEISSPTHSLQFEVEQSHAKLVGSKLAPLGSDLVVIVKQQDPFVPRLWVEPIDIEGVSKGADH